MKAWDGNGPTPAFTLDDDEVLALVRTGTITLEPGSTELVPAVSAWRRIQMRAEDILNEQRANRREVPSPERGE